MRNFRSLGLGLAALLASAAIAAHATAQDPAPRFRALVFSKTLGFRHESIATGIAAIQRLGQLNAFAVDATEDATRFSDTELARYDVVIWLSTTGDVLSEPQQAAFERYIAAGGGYVGVHAATDTEYWWPWYGELVGTFFASHATVQPATIHIEDPTHPSTVGVPTTWARSDEWYNFQTNPRATGVHVLATLDESSYDSGNAMQGDHPIAWCSRVAGGRSWYTAGGHTVASFQDDVFLSHLLGGIEYAAGVVDADCGPVRSATPSAADFRKVSLVTDSLGALQLEVTPDGRVLFIELPGHLRVWDPATNATTEAATIPIFKALENGLLGIALDPSFAQTGWLYLFYSDPVVSEQHVSRFTMVGNTLDMSSERVVLRIPHQREVCCHSGGGLEMGPDGSLYISTGDDSNPFESNGFDPIDERPGRAAYDAQRSAANTNDLRGKILRIVPRPDGSYAIPAGNLFDEATDSANLTRPEIYVMGARNAYRFSIDSGTGWLFWGEFSPDANKADPARGPAGTVEFNITKHAGFHGWPYCIGNNLPYVDYDFATGASGALFDCNAPVNNSPNNTGLTLLPPAEPATIWYTYVPVPEWPALGTGAAPMGGPVYRYDPRAISAHKFPALYDGHWFIADWNRSWLKTVKVGDGTPTNGRPMSGDLRAFPYLGYSQPIDMKFGPDGALYMVEWNQTAGIVSRVDYVRPTPPPIAHVTASRSFGHPPLLVSFSSAGSSSAEGDPLRYAWDLDGDGTIDSTDANPRRWYLHHGGYTARLTVTDTRGQSSSAETTIAVGNTPPKVILELPRAGASFSYGSEIPFLVRVFDFEDLGFDCSRVVVQGFLAPVDHMHPDHEVRGACWGRLQTPQQPTAAGDQPPFMPPFIVEASYSDRGSRWGAPSLTGSASVTLTP